MILGRTGTPHSFTASCVRLSLQVSKEPQVSAILSSFTLRYSDSLLCSASFQRWWSQFYKKPFSHYNVSNLQSRSQFLATDFKLNQIFFSRHIMKGLVESRVQFEQIRQDSVLIVFLTDLLVSDMPFNRTTCASQDRALSAQHLIWGKVAANLVQKSHRSRLWLHHCQRGEGRWAVFGWSGFKAEEWKAIISPRIL